MDMHMGRSWNGHPIEDLCPCHKAACGLVDEIDENCDQHAFRFSHTMRQFHELQFCSAA